MRNHFLFPILAGALSTPLLAQSAVFHDTSWSHLQAVPAHAHMHVSADHGSTTCYFIAADDATLTCGHADGGPKGRKVFQREQVKTVKLTRYGTSTLAGAGIGAAGGAIAGFAATSGPNGWFNGAIRAGMTGVGTVLGAAVLGPTDAFRGPTLYRRM